VAGSSHGFDDSSAADASAELREPVPKADHAHRRQCQQVRLHGTPEVEIVVERFDAGAIRETVEEVEGAKPSSHLLRQGYS